MLLRRLEFLGVGLGGWKMNINERLDALKEIAEKLQQNINNLIFTAMCMNDINNLNNYSESIGRLNAKLLDETKAIDQIVEFILENVQLIKVSRS